MIRVLIVDDHAVVRAGLRMLVDAEEDMETVGEAGTVREALLWRLARPSPISSYGPPRDQGRARELRARERVAGMSMRGIPTPRFRALPEAGAGGGSDTGGMKVSYGVRWRSLGPRRAGRLSVGDRSLHLVALDVDGVEEREVPFEEILEIDFCRPDRVLTVLLRSGEKIEMQTTVDRWIFDELAGKVTIAGAPSGQHEWHPGLGL